MCEQTKDRHDFFENGKTSVSTTTPSPQPPTMMTLLLDSKCIRPAWTIVVRLFRLENNFSTRRNGRSSPNLSSGEKKNINLFSFKTVCIYRQRAAVRRVGVNGRRSRSNGEKQKVQ